MPLAEQPEGRRRLVPARELLLIGHRRAVRGYLHLILDVLHRETERLLEQQQRRKGVPREWRVEKALADVRELGAIGEDARPLSLR